MTGIPADDVCTACGGTGKGTSFTRPDDPCGACGGTGKRPAPKPTERPTA